MFAGGCLGAQDPFARAMCPDPYGGIMDLMESTVIVEAVIQQIHLAAGIAGRSELDFDVRCFVVTGPSGLVLIDTGLEVSSPLIELALLRAGADWSEITDVVLTHSHPDHVGGLAEVMRNAPEAVSAPVRLTPLECLHRPQSGRSLRERLRPRPACHQHTRPHDGSHQSLPRIGGHPFHRRRRRNNDRRADARPAQSPPMRPGPKCH